MTQRDYWKNRKRQRKIDGKCTGCGVRIPVPGFFTCDPCMERRQEYEIMYANERADAGLCLRHGKKPVPGKRGCKLCHAYWKKRDAKIRAKRKAEKQSTNQETA